jgi:hypothetical protein
MSDPVESHATWHGRNQSDTYIRLFVVLIMLASLVVVLMTFRSHFLMGGHPWNTADWLINADNVHVRRGLFGSVLLRISDTLHLSPLVIAILLQCGLAILITAGALRAILASSAPGLTAVLLLSPGFCLLFWAGDPHGTARKEMITFAAMALLLFTNGKEKHDRTIVIAAGLLFAFGVSGHIANAMMTPMFLFMAWVALGRTGTPWIVAAVLLCIWAAFNTWYPIRYSGIDSAMEVCRPLMERGLDENFCSRAIRVTADHAESALVFVAEYAYGRGLGAWHLLIYPGLLLPILYLLSRTNGARALLWPMVLSVLPLLPLYTVGLDWGRQTVMHITPILLLVALMLLRGRIHQTKQIPLKVSLVLLVLGVIWSPKHVFGLDWGMPASMIMDLF